MLPDTELWPNEYVQVVFDSDPTAEVAHLRSKSADARRAAAGVPAKHRGNLLRMSCLSSALHEAESAKTPACIACSAVHQGRNSRW